GDCGARDQVGGTAWANWPHSARNNSRAGRNGSLGAENVQLRFAIVSAVEIARPRSINNAAIDSKPLAIAEGESGVPVRVAGGLIIGDRTEVGELSRSLIEGTAGAEVARSEVKRRTGSVQIGLGAEKVAAVNADSYVTGDASPGGIIAGVIEADHDTSR